MSSPLPASLLAPSSSSSVATSTSTLTATTISSRRCSACNNPPYRDEKNNAPMKMLRCSRCHQAWYHDSTCQRRHYKVHKKTCRRLSSNTSTKSSSTSTPNTVVVRKSVYEHQYECQLRPKRGRCMIANQAMAKGTRITPVPSSSSIESSSSSKESSYFESIVPPVLMTQERHTRCSFCFETLYNHSSSYISNSNINININSNSSTHNLFQYCSLGCKRKGNELSFDSQLLRSISLLSSSSSSSSSSFMKSITPVTILLYRILSRIHHEETLHSTLSSSSASASASVTKKSMDQLTSNHNHQQQQQQQLTEDEKQYRENIAQRTLHLFYTTYTTTTTTTSKSNNNNNNNNNNSNNNNNHYFTMEDVYKMTNQIIYNSFSISNTMIQQTIGLGLFPQASIANHSCAPNIIQSFTFSNTNSNTNTSTNSQTNTHTSSQKETPKLILTTNQPITKNEEMCIGYMNVLDLYTNRLDYCKKGYKFVCSCQRCTLISNRTSSSSTSSTSSGSSGSSSTNSTNISSNNDYDTLCEILKCPTKNCKGFCYEYDIGKEMNISCHLCNGNGSSSIASASIITTNATTSTTTSNNNNTTTTTTTTTFQTIKDLRDKQMKIVHSISQKLENKRNNVTSTSTTSTASAASRIVTTSSTTISEIDIEQLETAYKSIKTCCHYSSWYVQESGQILVDCLLQLQQINNNNNHNHHRHNSNSNSNSNETLTRKLCTRALIILEEVTSHCKTESYDPLSSIMNELKLGKLLLYIYPDPCRAISILQQVRSKLLLYYPKHDEIIGTVEEMLMSAYQ